VSDPEDVKDGAAAVEAPKGGEAEAAPGPEGEPATEEKGLVGVDAEPLPPPSREEIEALRRERDELRELLLRKRADFENYRRRVERDRHQAGLDAAASLLKALIPTLDDLERALSSESPEGALREGLELIQRDLRALLESQGLVVDDPAGRRFDPQIHQALSHEVAPGFPEGTVVEVHRKGYFFRDRLLRPALVKVAKAPGDAEDRGPETVH
jgi:molecular chaperone GrpE